MAKCTIARYAATAFSIAVALPLARDAMAGPTIIRDARITDTSTTPLLGRGYSISTNTFQSACMKDVAVTEPSYDFSYTFEDIGEDTAQRDKQSQADRSASKRSRWWTWSRETIQENSVTETQTQTKTNNIVINLTVDTYYASVDEANTNLSDAAQSLLTNDDLPGFFAACGPYYTRSLNRSATYSSVLNFKSTSARTDKNFSRLVNKQIRGWAGDRQDVSGFESGEFSRQASTKDLMIFTSGWGLGKNDNASLIATDVGRFKEAIKQAFVSMQNPGTGRVESIEVIPWVENVDFQSLVQLRGEDFVENREVPLYEKKDILTNNGEFITELQRQGRHILNLYYKARLCTTWMRSNWARTGNIDSDVAEAPLTNHRKPWADSITVERLWKTLRADDEDRSLAKEINDLYMSYMYTGRSNATKCLAELFKDPSAAITLSATGTPAARAQATTAEERQAAGEQAKGGDEEERARAAASATTGGVPTLGGGRGIFLKRYFDHPECTQMEVLFGGVELPELVEDYCLPELVDGPHTISAGNTDEERTRIPPGVLGNQ